MQKQDEIAFAKQLNDFDISMQNDLNHRSSEVAKKWQFDFSMEQPLQKPALNNMMSWEPLE